MDKMPEIVTLSDGTKMWEAVFEKFEAGVYVPVPEENIFSDIVNFGFKAPYLLVFEEEKQTQEGRKQYAEEKGLAEIAAENGGSVVFIYPTNAGGWDLAPDDLFEAIIAESKISQYYKDGVALMRDRFTGNWGKVFIRGAVLRTYLYGFGASADYIAKHCLKTIEGEGLYGRGDVTPVCCILENLHVIPTSERRDIPVVSVGNSEEVNVALAASVEHLLVADKADYRKDFKTFVSTFYRMVGFLNKELDFEKSQTQVEPGYVVVPTSPDNRGDDKDTKEHKIGYVAFYNKGIMDTEKGAPLVMCFHGGGDSAFCMATNSGWARVASENNFLLVCVENHMNSTATESVALIEQLKKKYKIDSERIYSTGFSMGGCKSWDMFQEFPKVFAAVAPMDATFDVGLNVFGQPSMYKINQDTIVPTFYTGGEITPLPELPFQEEKCRNRMEYVMRLNQSKTKYDVKYEEREHWVNPIWGIDGDVICKLHDDARGSDLTLHLFESENGCCYAVFGSISGQGHEVRHHTCENAWKFLSSFRRLPDGTLQGGNMVDIQKLYS